MTFGLCLISQLHSKNMSVLFRSVTATYSCFLCLLILISRGAKLVTSLFFVPSVLKTSNEKLISLVCILFSLTSCLSIPVWVYLESTSALTLRFFLFLVLTFTHTFNSFSILLLQFRIIYLNWEFTGEISCTVLTWDYLQNSVSLSPFLCLLCHLISSEFFISSSPVFLYSPWLYALLCHIWNISLFLILSSLTSIPLPCVHTCCNWSTLASHPWNCCWTF